MQLIHMKQGWINDKGMFFGVELDFNMKGEVVALTIHNGNSAMSRYSV